ncbi:MAG: hypothetical protein AB1847_09735 [bacterium]
MNQKPITCKKCGLILNESLLPEMRIPCPMCGSISRSFEVSIEEKIKVYSKLGLRHKRGRVPGRHSYESITGADLHKKTGKWMKIDRVIDRENDFYFEKVIDPKTKKIVHCCQEPLSSHQGHGSAKKKE